MNKFRKNLKSSGMEDEFKFWMKRHTQTLKPGMKIRVIDFGNTSLFYKRGDIGIIEETDSDTTPVVKFGLGTLHPGSWLIGRSRFEVIE